VDTRRAEARWVQGRRQSWSLQLCARVARVHLSSARATRSLLFGERAPRRSSIRALAERVGCGCASNAHAHGLKPARVVSVCVLARADTKRTPHLLLCPGGQRALTESCEAAQVSQGTRVSPVHAVQILVRRGPCCRHGGSSARFSPVLQCPACSPPGRGCPGIQRWALQTSYGNLPQVRRLTSPASCAQAISECQCRLLERRGRGKVSQTCRILGSPSEAD
jgi:hypothetical protein